MWYTPYYTDYTTTTVNIEMIKIRGIIIIESDIYCRTENK